MNEFGPNGKLIAPMTVLQVIPHLDAGGAEQTCIEIAEALVADGHNAIVAGKPGRLTDALTEVGGSFFPFNGTTKSPLGMSRNARLLARLIRHGKVDLVHARSRAPAWSARSAARRRDVPFMTTYHGIYSENSWVKKLYNSVMVSGEKVIANSAFTADIIRQRYQTPEAKLTVINRCFDPRVFDPHRFDESAIKAQRESWGITAGQKVVVLPGRLTSWKGQAVLLEAVARLKSRNPPDFAVVLVGDDQGRDTYSQELKTLANEAGVPVHFAGHSANMALVFAASDVAVSASTKPEAFGRTIVEAQAMRCPVIVSDLGPVHETVRAYPDVSEDDTTGWIVPPSDPSALCDALFEALSLPETARELIGERARAHVLSRYTTAQMTAATLTVYEELIANRQQVFTFP